MQATINTVSVVGITGYPASVTCYIDNTKLPAFDVVGLPELALRESRARVRSAIRHAGFEFPKGQVHVTVDTGTTGPAHHPTGFDLPIAIAVLAAAGQAQPRPEDAFIGELSLTGAVRSACGVSVAVEAMPDKRWYVPKDAARLAQAMKPFEKAIACESLQQVVLELAGNGPVVHVPEPSPVDLRRGLCWSDVRGHEQAKRALEVAAAGGHNAVLLGSPGTGKTMLSRRLPTILPPLSEAEAKEVTALFDVAGLLPNYAGLFTHRPFRAPHHTCSASALVGGGSIPRPGEVSLAHRGVLFLDELPEFPRHVIESLRQPLEDGHVTVTRARQTVRFPAQAQVIAALNPCPCGLFGDNSARCQCSPLALERYRDRLSGQMLDRFDIQIRLTTPAAEQLRSSTLGDTSEVVQARVVAARARQTARWNDGCTNASVSMSALRKTSPLRPVAHDLLLRALDVHGLSPRAHDRVWRIARTIADLDGAEDIGVEHVGEALQYRWFDQPQGNK